MRVLLGIFLLVAAAPMMLHAAAQREAKEHPDLARLAAQFRVYRDIARKEQQTPEFRKWGGPVHKLMSEVGEYIEREHYPAREVTALLGKPDEIIAGGGRHNGIRVPRGESHWGILVARGARLPLPGRAPRQGCAITLVVCGRIEHGKDVPFFTKPAKIIDELSTYFDHRIALKNIVVYMG